MNPFETSVPEKEAEEPEHQKPELPELPGVQPGLQEIIPTPEVDRKKDYHPDWVQGEIDRIDNEEGEDDEHEKEVDRIIDERDHRRTLH